MHKQTKPQNGQKFEREEQSSDRVSLQSAATAQFLPNYTQPQFIYVQKPMAIQTIMIRLHLVI